MKTCFMIPCGAALLALASSVLAAGSGGSDRPNVLLVTADDLGLQLSCYGETRIATPRLDALAREGVRFEKAYVAQSSCSSSRSALLTGRFPHENGQVGLAHLGFRMHPGQPNLVALLKSAGYHTGIIGKLHVEPAGEFPFDWMPAREKVAAGPTRDVKWVAAQSRQFFAAARESGRPFFYYVNYFDPHGPLTPETDQVGGIPARPLSAARIAEPLPFRSPTEAAKTAATARYLNTVLRLDEGLGLLLGELQSAGCAANTIVIYVGDNGLAGVRGKSTSYELGVRVPMIVRWPGAAKAGQVRQELVSLLDVMPTVLEAAGAAAPAGLAGRPLQPLLHDAPAQWRKLLFTEMNFHEPQQCSPQRTVRDARHKLVLNLRPADDQQAVELYDLADDPWETRNLAGVPGLASTRARLEAALEQWRTQSADPLLDARRLQRWQDAATRWGKLPRIKTAVKEVVRVPEGELKLLE